MELKYTDYYRNKVLNQRPDMTEEVVKYVLSNYEYSEIQEDGRKRFWAYIERLKKFVRVVLEPTGEVLNAMPDRNYTKRKLREKK